MQLVTKFAGDNTCATKIWQGLLGCVHESTDAINTSKQLLRYITHANILDWRGTTHDFLLNWTEQVRRYHEIVGPAEVLNDATLLRYLQDCVAHVPALKNIENMINVMAQGASTAGTTLTPEQKYAQYWKLIVEACTNYDTTYKPSQHCRKTNYHQQDDDDIIFNSLTNINTI